MRAGEPRPYETLFLLVTMRAGEPRPYETFCEFTCCPSYLELLMSPIGFYPDQ